MHAEAHMLNHTCPLIPVWQYMMEASGLSQYKEVLDQWRTDVKDLEALIVSRRENLQERQKKLEALQLVPPTMTYHVCAHV